MRHLLRPYQLRRLNRTSTRTTALDPATSAHAAAIRKLASRPVVIKIVPKSVKSVEQEEATLPVSHSPEQTGVPEDTVLKALKYLVLNEDYEAARTSLTRCCLASKHFFLLARPFLKQHRKQHLILEFDSVWRDTGIRLDFLSHTLTPASATRTTVSPEVASKIRSMSSSDQRAETALGQVGGVDTSRAWYPLRTTSPNRASSPFSPNILAPTLTSFTFAFSFYGHSTVDLSPLVSLTNLTILLKDDSSSSTPSALFSCIGSTGSAPRSATSFRLTLGENEYSYLFAVRWRSVLGVDFMTKLFKDQRMGRVRAVDASGLSMGVELRKRRKRR
ncbi:hypothetical protein JCM8547_005757 [Rhodosporidiobolus lusitaniae]